MKTSAKVRNIILIIAMAAAVSLPLGLTACGTSFNDRSSDGLFGDLTTAESVYGFSAASAGMIISAMNGEEAGGMLLASAATEGAADDTAGGATGGTEEGSGDVTADPELTELDGYMELVGTLLSDGGFRCVTEESDRAEYTEKTTVSYTDINGERSEYVMYYNELLIPDDDDDDDDRDEIEEEYAIDGVMVIGGTDYPIRGERSFEQEGFETEAETEFRVTLGEDRYLYVEQGYEDEGDEYEQEYSYSLREGRRTIERSTFSYEEEDGETELKMITENASGRQIFLFDRERHRGEEVIRLRVGEGRDIRTYYLRSGPDGWERI